MTMYEVVINWGSASGEFKNILHYETDAVHGADMDAMADFLSTAYLLHFRDRVAPGVSLISVSVREDIVGAVAVDYPMPLSPLVGLAGDDQWAGQLALLVRKLNLSGNRPAQGRIYLPGVTSEALTATGEWAQNVAADAQDFLEELRDFQAPISGPLWVMHIKASNPDAPNTVTYASVDAVQAVTNPTTQRRRRKGVGV